MRQFRLLFPGPTRGGGMKREPDSGEDRKAKRPRATADTAPDEFDTHVTTHRCKTCDKCIYASNRATWEAAARMPGGVGTWLQPQPVANQEWWLGCSICSKGTSLRRTRKLHGTSLHLGNIRAHGRSQTHIRACKVVTSASNHAMEAPPTSEFDDAWNNAALGRKNHNMSLRKSTSLEWCLAEAIRDEDREFLRHSDAIAILLDERNCRLLVKFQACGSNLVVRFGVFALLRNAGKTAPQIAAAVHQAVRALCTRRAAHPSMNCLKSQMRRWAKLMNHLCSTSCNITFSMFLTVMPPHIWPATCCTKNRSAQHWQRKCQISVWSSETVRTARGISTSTPLLRTQRCNCCCTH